jgi:hypothetical protein
VPISYAGAVTQVIESILDDDNDMQDMYLGRRAAVEAALQAHQVFLSQLLLRSFSLWTRAVDD